MWNNWHIKSVETSFGAAFEQIHLLTQMAGPTTSYAIQETESFVYRFDSQW